MFNITSNHVTGFVVGVGASALGFYFYKANQRKADEFLRGMGLNLPAQEGKDVASMSLQELVMEKERLEDLIAEREMALHKTSQPA